MQLTRIDALLGLRFPPTIRAFPVTPFNHLNHLLALLCLASVVSVTQADAMDILVAESGGELVLPFLPEDADVSVLPVDTMQVGELQQWDLIWIGGGGCEESRPHLDALLANAGNIVAAADGRVGFWTGSLDRDARDGLGRSEELVESLIHYLGEAEGTSLMVQTGCDAGGHRHDRSYLVSEVARLAGISLAIASELPQRVFKPDWVNRAHPLILPPQSRSDGESYFAHQACHGALLAAPPGWEAVVGASEESHACLLVRKDRDDCRDFDIDGVCDAQDPDDDGDGVLDEVDADPWDPSVCQDSDGDGCDDCALGRDGFGAQSDVRPEEDGPDHDGDGVCDITDLCTGLDSSGDSDGDGLCDDTDLDDDNDGLEDRIDPSPLSVDGDGDGLCDTSLVDSSSCDGGEDLDADGVVDAGESDPADSDSDDDGLSDGDEVLWLGTNPLDADTDDDGLQDGTEVGISLDEAQTGTDMQVFIPDMDPYHTTNPLSADTDGGGVRDGIEDRNRNGMLDLWEGDPNEGSDDAVQAPVCDADSVDCDGDGIPDELERAAGTNPWVANERGVRGGATTGCSTSRGRAPRVPSPEHMLALLFIGGLRYRTRS